MSDPHVLEDGHAPTPFTADEISQNCVPGRTVTTSTERPGAEPVITVSRFLAADEEGVLFDAGGSQSRVTWIALQAHASFPADSTTIAEETIELPIGTAACLRYTVSRHPDTHRFWFDKSRPGMPVRHTKERDGIEVERTTMISDQVVPPAGTAYRA